jgi:hypothetical protein
VPLYKAAKEGEVGAIKLLIEEYTVEDIDDITVSSDFCCSSASDDVCWEKKADI